MNNKSFFILTIILLTFSLPVSASPQTSAVSSPKCDEAKIKLLTGDALIKIEKAEWGGDLKGFNITLETSKMTFGDLTKKMLDAGCF